MKKLLVYLKGYARECVLGPLLKLLEAFFDLIVPLIVASMIDRGILLGDKGWIVKMSLALAALALIGLAFAVIAQYFCARAAIGVSTKLRHALMKHIQTLGFTEIDRLGTSTLITRMTSDVNQVQSGINMALRLLLRSPFIVFGAMVMAFTIDFGCALVFLAVIIVLCVIVFSIMLATMPMHKRVQHQLDSVTAATRENLTGVRVIRAFCKEEEELSKFSKRNELLTKLQMAVGRISALMNPLTYVVINLAVIALIRTGALKVEMGTLTQGEVVALYNYMSQILVELVKMASLIILLTKSLSCAGRISDVLSVRPSQEDGLLRTEAEVQDFMETYDKVSSPELVQSIYAGLSLVACLAIAVFAGLRHGVSMGVQILSTSLLVAVPASFFVSITRPMAILEKRLHMVGSVLCGWEGVKDLCGKVAIPLTDQDLFPQGSTKLNGVKFYGDRNPDEVVAFSTALITKAGGGLVPVFKQLLKSRDGLEHAVDNFQNYGSGGIGGEVCGEPVLLGTLNFLQDMGVEIPEGTMVSQAVYAAIDGQLSAVYAISYAKMRSAAAGLVTLSGYSKLTPVMLCGDFMLTESFIRAKFDVKTRRIAFPTREERELLKAFRPDPDEPVLALTTREELVGTAYAITGARALRRATKLGVIIHLIGGVLGLIIMLALGFLGSTELLTPTNILLYQLIWAVPGLLITEWTRVV